MNSSKQHHWITAGHILFREKKTGNIFTTRLYNGLIKSPKQELTLKDISSIQQSFFMRAITEYDQTQVETIDMVVSMVSYLGYFSDEEFVKNTNVDPNPKVNETLREAELIN